MAFQRVAIVGLGLIGASLGLALHRLPRPPQVVGYDRARDAVGRANRRHAIDRAAPSASAARAASAASDASAASAPTTPAPRRCYL